MSTSLPWLEANSTAFPSVNTALSDPNGLLAIGGDLSTKRLIHAYSQGIFPWFNDDEPILWWSPSPRAIIETAQIKINKTLKKQLKKSPYTVTLNNCFDQVIAYCAQAPFRKEGTWINNHMRQAYLDLHQQGYAHSIEVWHQDKLVGGLYGVAINGFFSGESMFYLKSNASKIALVYLCGLLREQNIHFIDCQINNPFLESMGCIELEREDFVAKQQTALQTQLKDNFWLARRL